MNHGIDREPYAAAKHRIPLRPNGYTRIYVYRPQALVGMFGSPVVIINGRWMGNPKTPSDNLLLPGTVFVADASADVTRVWWHQEGKGEETDKAISLPLAEGSTWYLRWGMKPTYGFLEVVSEREAISEIERLRFSGYVIVDGP
jgi:hypothetical protein